MKTTPKHHQKVGLEKSGWPKSPRPYFGWLMDQGTGKTWVMLCEIERLYEAGQIDAAFILAPNGVHEAWVIDQIPQHVNVGYIVPRFWISGAGKRTLKRIEEVFDARPKGGVVPLRILTMNYDALITKKGFDFAARFLNSAKAAYIAADESHTIKNLSSGRTKAAIALRKLCAFARIASGTPMDTPLDIFAQFEFLAPDEGLLGTTSYRAFVTEYAQIMRPDHPMMIRMAKTNPKVLRAQIVEKDEKGNPIYKNLDKLAAMVAEHSFRVRKEDCLDLPEKVYAIRYYELEYKQLEAYLVMESEYRIAIEGDPDPDFESVAKLSAQIKMRQILSGFVNRPNGAGLMQVSEKNPRLEATLEAFKAHSKPAIIWACFTEEIDALEKAIAAEGFRVAVIDGRRKDRMEVVTGFQNLEYDALIIQIQINEGFTLTAAQTVIYHSKDWRLKNRLQSEDRAHRIGQTKTVLYIDIVARDTVDRDITLALQRKESVASAVQDRYRYISDQR